VTVSEHPAEASDRNSDLPSEASYDHAAGRNATFTDCFADHLVR
jgi:hypothetical protein